METETNRGRDYYTPIPHLCKYKKDCSNSSAMVKKTNASALQEWIRLISHEVSAEL